MRRIKYRSFYYYTIVRFRDKAGTRNRVTEMGPDLVELGGRDKYLI